MKKICTAACIVIGAFIFTSVVTADDYNKSFPNFCTIGFR